MKMVFFYTVVSMLLGISATTRAENHWSNYQGVQSNQNQHRPHDPQNSYPQYRPNYPNRPYPPRLPHTGYPIVQPGLSIQYQAPTTITNHSESYSWVNGDPNSARIESSTYNVVTNWQNLGLPAPPRGSYWIYQHGRYLLMSNR